MVFLQPWMLWGLALVVVPVLIHLLNRLRYRSLDWAAMSFLLSASRQAQRSARIRHWLVLACRAGAIAMMMLAMARPLVGGWLGGMLRGPPDSIVLLVDRSPSMEGQAPSSVQSKRQVALARFKEALRALGGAAQVTLVNTATRETQELLGGVDLSKLSATGLSDAATDWPAVCEAALDHVQATGSGRAEIWIASDLQASDWRATDARWERLRARLATMPQEVRIRVLALREAGGPNLAIRVVEVLRQGSELLLTCELDGPSEPPPTAGTVPVALVLDGARSVWTVSYRGGRLRWQQHVALPSGQDGAGWGWVELPADGNIADNVSYFAYPALVPVRSVVVSDEPGGAVARVLQLAAAPSPLLNRSARVVTPHEVTATLLSEAALVQWHSAEPAPRALEDFVKAGGFVLRWPAGQGRAGEWTVTWWNRGDDVLADGRDGVPLAVDELEVRQRVDLTDEGATLATMSDGAPLWQRRLVGGLPGWYECATLPVRAWSNLGEGPVLVPVVQRLAVRGAQRLGGVQRATVGEVTGIGAEESWVSVADGTAVNGVPMRACVYRVSGRLVALNRPASEDEPGALAESELRAVFEPARVWWFDEAVEADSGAVSEVWWWFWLALVGLLLVESVLTMGGWRAFMERGAATSAGRVAEGVTA
ncbi:MAG: BatA domain-containing protein [Verrucomicrobiae bacterium]|nr:BatA domain-containing protein [Verrucomicrobiae bacterium]